MKEKRENGFVNFKGEYFSIKNATFEGGFISEWSSLLSIIQF